MTVETYKNGAAEFGVSVAKDNMGWLIALHVWNRSVFISWGGPK